MAPRRRFVNTGKINKETEHITQANAAQSPFFSLSPEIRNRIYDLVLSGKHLHVNTVFRGHPKCYLCQATETDNELVKPAAWRLLGEEPHHECRTLCKTPSTSSSDSPGTTKAERTIYTNLLLASRQIHQEAALIAFAKNTFMFGTATTPLVFTRELLARQRRAITNVIVEEPFWALPSYCPTSRGLFQKLPGLKRVKISMAVFLLEATSPTPTLTQLKTRLEEIQKALQGRSLAQVSIEVLVQPGSVTQDDAQKRLEPFRKLAREAETAILASQSEES